MAAHLAPGGLAVVDVWLPDAEDLARFDGRVILEWPRTRSARPATIVTKAGSAQYDRRPATVTLTTIFEEGAQGGAGRALGPPRPAAAHRRPTSSRVRRGRRAAGRAARRRLRPGPAGSGQRAGRPASPSSRLTAALDRRAGPPGGCPERRARGIVEPDVSSSSDQIRLLLVEDVPQVAQYIRGPAEHPGQRQAARRPDRRRARPSPRSPSSGPTSSLVDALLQGRIKGPKLVEQIHEAEPGRPGHRPDRAPEPGRGRPRARASTRSCRCRSPATT